MIGGPLQLDPTAVANSVNYVWVLVVSFLIFFVQPGFALLEAGQVRAKNVGNVLTKNVTDWALGVLSYFVLGAGVASLVGMLTSGASVDLLSAFSSVGAPGSTGWINWLFGAVFAMTAATIVSGAVAETAGRIHGGRSWVYDTIDLETKVVLDVAALGRRGIGSAAAFLHGLARTTIVHRRCFRSMATATRLPSLG